MIIYEPGLMQVASGRVVFVKHRTVTTDEVSVTANGAVATSEQKSQYIEIQLDTHHEPFAINTTRNADFFIGEGDEVNIAGIWQGSHIDIYGIRNATDGSIYVARPERVESRSISYGASGLMALGCLGCIVWFAVDEGLDLATLAYLVFLSVLITAGVFCIFSLRRWGVFSNDIISEHTQAGDKEEMERAQSELRLTRDERRRITPL